MAKLIALALAGLAFLTPVFASATANYVYHEQTTNLVGGSCGTYVTNLSPTPAQSYPLEFKIEYQFYTDNAVVYYTTDGSPPSGAMGVASGTTTAVAASYSCTFLDPLGSGLNDDTTSATLPAEPAGTTVNYIVGAWHSGGGSEVFANSGTCGTCTACTTSSCATVFSYTVTTPVDSGVDAAPSDAGAPKESSVDAAADAGVDAGADAGVDASLEAGFDAPAFDAPSPEGSANDAAGTDDGVQPLDATIDAAPRPKDAEADTPHVPFDAFQIDAGASGPAASGCGCSTPGDAAAAGWGPLASLGSLFLMALLGSRRRR